MAWQDNRRSTFDYDIYFAKSYDGGATFTPNVRVNDPTATLSWQERPSIAVTANGVIYVAWTDDRTGYLRIRGSYSTDWGETFSPSKELSSGGTSGQDEVVLAANGNRIYAAFMDNFSGITHPYFCVSSNGGKTFSSAARLDDVGDAGIAQRDIAIATMPGGGIVAAWEDNRAGIWDIYMSTISARGTAGMPNIRVDDSVSDSNKSDPCVASDALGNIYAAWVDERDYLIAIRFAYMISGSGAFNASVAVSNPGPNAWQLSPSVAVAEPGRVYISWADDKLTDYDAYCSSAYIPDLLGIPLMDGWNLISIPADVTGLRASTLGLRNGDIVSSWNSTSQSFSEFYVVGLSPSMLDFELTPSNGYWIYTAAHETVKLKSSVPHMPQSKHLNVPHGGGWTMIGFESFNTTRSASDIPLMTDVIDSVTIVAGYDPSSGSYLYYTPGLPFTDFVLVPGQAYWCWLTTSSTLTYSP